MAELKALKDLTIRHCNISDIALLPNSLQRLELNNCEAVDINRLAELNQLKELKLSNTKITTLAAPLGIQNLELKACRELEDFNLLPNLVKLESLHLSVSRFKDLSLVPCDSLKRLTLDYCQIKEYGDLAKLTKLEWLKLNIGGANDFPQLPSAIEYLEVSGHKAKNFNSLYNLRRLKVLSLNATTIEDLPLMPLSIEKLHIGQCDIKNFSYLAWLPKLKEVALSVTSTNKLLELPISLERLTLWGGKDHKGFDSLTNFPDCTNLSEFKKLTLDQVNNLPVLPATLTELEIWSGGEDTESFAHLANAQKLERLVLIGVSIDLSVLPSSLKELTLRQCKHIEFCPKWLKEKIRKKQIIIKDYNIENLLLKPTPPPKPDPDPLPLEEFPLPVLLSIFQKLDAQDQANWKLASNEIMQQCNMSHVSFSANNEIVNFLSYHEVLEPETLDKLYMQGEHSGLTAEGSKIYKERGLPSESHLKLYSNFLAIKALTLSNFIVKKELLETLLEISPNVQRIMLGNIDPELAHELERLPLKEIKKLSINSCRQLINFDFLSNLKGLTVLSLSHSAGAELSSVPQGVEELSLFQFNIKASANKLFAQLIRLKKLYLTYTDIADLSTLPMSLEELKLFVCAKAKDFDALARLISLRKLDLWQTKIEDISILPASLKELSLVDCRYIKDLSSLTFLKSLEKLDLSSSKIEDLLVLPNSLKELNLKRCSYIKYCPEWLKEKIKRKEIIIRNYDTESLLDMPISPPSSLGPQQESGGLAPSAAYIFKASEIFNRSYKNYSSLLDLATSLKALILHHCNIGDFAHLANLQELRKLDLSHTNIEDLSVLPASLKELLLTECKNIADFASLANCQDLEKLEIPSVKIADLSVLPTNLIELDLWKCQHIEDFTHLARLEKLEKLNLSWTKIKDLSVLPANLKEVWLVQCNDIEFCPALLKEKIRTKEIIIKGYSLEKLLAMPSSAPEEQQASTLVTSPELTSSSRSMLDI